MLTRMKKKTLLYTGTAIGVLVFFLYLFIQTADEIREREIEVFDSKVIGIIQSLVSPKLTELMLFITALGSITWLTFAAVLLMGILMYKKEWQLGLFIGLSSGVGALFNILLKTLFKRERPDIQPLILEQGFSFPSGHSMGSFILYGAAAYLVFHYGKNKKQKLLGTGFLLLIIILIGISRIYLGVHFPSDIAGGYSAGGAWLTACIIMLKYYESRKKLKSSRKNVLYGK